MVCTPGITRVSSVQIHNPLWSQFPLINPVALWLKCDVPCLPLCLGSCCPQFPPFFQTLLSPLGLGGYEWLKASLWQEVWRKSHPVPLPHAGWSGTKAENREWVYVTGAPQGSHPQGSLFYLCNSPRDREAGVEVLTAPSTECLSLGCVVRDSPWTLWMPLA